MSRYRRAKIEGGIFFFTLALADRSSDLLIRHIDRLRHSYRAMWERLPFDTIAVCILPNHLHALCQLPDGDTNFASRWIFLALKGSEQVFFNSTPPPSFSFILPICHACLPFLIVAYGPLCWLEYCMKITIEILDNSSEYAN
jgi:hypothetical protein